MAWIVEVLTLLLEIGHFERLEILYMKYLSLLLTAFNGAFTLCDAIVYRCHPLLAFYHMTMFSSAIKHFLYSPVDIFHS